jgi:hypothetical protein
VQIRNVGDGCITKDCEFGLYGDTGIRADCT